MPRNTGKAHVVRVKKTHVDKQGHERVYESVLLRRTYRDGAKVRNETVANLSMLPPQAVDAIEATLKGHTLVPAGSEFSKSRSLPHGDVAAVAAMARKLELAAVLGPAVPSPRYRARVDHLAGGAAQVEAVHPVVVAQHHPRRRFGGGRGLHRRDLRRDGLAGRPTG
nr:hypothetical protein [Mycobacterium riyadhense]